jgi:putative ABC transport system permease protein
MIQYELSLSYLFEKGLNGYAISIGLILLIIGGILISGFYPAFVLSSFKPAMVLKGKFSASKKGIALRKGLVIGQFAITVALIIGSFVVSRQMQFMSKQNLGMNISQILIIREPGLTSWDSTFIERENTFMDELKAIPNILGSANSGRLPGDELGRNFNVRRADQPNDRFTFRNQVVSKDFIPLYDIQLLAGRNFTPTDYNPSYNLLHNIIINEQGAKLLGFKKPEEAIGKQIIAGNKTWDIVGVIADFHQKSFRYPLEATFLRPVYGTGNPISVKVNPRDLTATIAAIRKKYDAFFPGNLFAYYFLDEKFNDQYKNDQLFGSVFGIFSAFAIFVACLGLLGLSYFATIQRTKEIGVRKVLGCSVRGIVVLLSKDFLRLVLIAFILASPLAWLVMHMWLQDFAFRIRISWWIFLVAGSLALIIALLTISFQAISAALANPVKSLKEM